MTRVVCTADIHEHLPEIPECDLLLIAGDVSFALKGDLATEHAFLEGPFAEWLERVPAAETVLIAGNHDQSIEAWGVPAGLRCHYRLGETEIINAAYVDNDYKPANPLVEVEL
jgi:metallophosphoesterase superfamily enzyme